MNIGLAWFNKLRRKIAQFDIKPAKPLLPGLLEQAVAADEAGNHTEYIRCLSKALLIRNTDKQILLSLGEAYFSAGNFNLAEKILLRGIKHHPLDYRYYQVLGQCYAYTYKTASSIKAYQRSLELNPNLPSVHHLLNGAKNITPAIAPSQYIQDLFDDYALTFDRCLVDNLKYRGHIELAEYIATIPELRTQVNNILDLGCGTGLLGQELTKKFTPQILDGVDLAAKMLEKSQERKIYHSLHQMDVLEYLDACQTTYDVIGSSDVFVYIGDLGAIISRAYQVLNPGGCLAFTIEKLDQGDFKLKYNGRFTHSLSYITSLSYNTGFNKIYSKAIDLRKEYGNIVAGYLVLLQK